MLNVDMALAFPVSTDLPPQRGRRQVCGPKTIKGGLYGCRDPDDLSPPTTWELCLSYAEDNSVFVNAFARAYEKMSCVGYGGVPGTVDGSTSTGKLGTLTSIDFSTCPAQLQQ